MLGIKDDTHSSSTHWIADSLYRQYLSTPSSYSPCLIGCHIILDLLAQLGYDDFHHLKEGFGLFQVKKLIFGIELFGWL